MAYFALNQEWARQQARRAVEGNRGGGNIKWGKLQQGANIIRILPPWDQTGQLAFITLNHRNLPLDAKKWYPCLKSYGAAQCPICDVLEELKRSNIKVVARYQQQSQVNAIDRHNETEGVQVYGLPTTVWKWIAPQLETGVVGDISDPNAGVDLVIIRSGTGIQTEYATSFSMEGRTPLSRDPNLMNSWLSNLYNLSDIFKIPQGERLEEMISFADQVRLAYGLPPRGQRHYPAQPVAPPPPAPVQVQAPAPAPVYPPPQPVQQYQPPVQVQQVVPQYQVPQAPAAVQQIQPQYVQPVQQVPVSAPAILPLSNGQAAQPQKPQGLPPQPPTMLPPIFGKDPMQAQLRQELMSRVGRGGENGQDDDQGAENNL